MSDDEADGEDAEAESEGPPVELGAGEEVPGAPLERVASRLTWPIERSAIVEKEGDTVVRTPDGPQTVAELLEPVDDTYFDQRDTFVQSVRDGIGTGSVATE